MTLMVQRLRHCFGPAQQLDPINQVKWAHSSPFAGRLRESARSNEIALRRMIRKAAKEFAHNGLPHGAFIALTLSNYACAMRHAFGTQLDINPLIARLANDMHLIATMLEEKRHELLELARRQSIDVIQRVNTQDFGRPVGADTAAQPPPMLTP